MASGYSVYAANLINQRILHGAALTPPSSLWVALYKTGSDTFLRNDNLASASANEVSGGSYTRLEILGSTGRGFTTSSAGLIENAETWTFPQATALWGTITTAALIDTADNTGHVWYWGNLAANKTVTSPDIFRFLAGAFDIQL